MIARRLRKKALLGLGFVTATTPIVTIVSCDKLIVGDVDPLMPTDANYAKVASQIRAQGSSSVLPIMTGLKNALVDFQYEGTGSGDGLKVATGEITGKDFGATSSLKNPSSAQAAKWASDRNKTITFAVDAIGITLHLPKSLSGLNSYNRPIVDAVELARLYDNDSNNNNVTWDDLLLNTEANGNHESVVPLGRTGGKSSSGTSDGFFNGLTKASGIPESKLDVNHILIPPSQLTAEANAAALQNLSQQQNGLAYISLGYALENESSNAIVAKIKTSTGATWDPSKIENVETKLYNWTRPFNIIYSLNNKAAISFAKTILSNQVQYAIKKIGFISTDEIKKQLFLDSNKDTTRPIDDANINPDFYKSDAELVNDVTKDILGLGV